MPEYRDSARPDPSAPAAGSDGARSGAAPESLEALMRERRFDDAAFAARQAEIRELGHRIAVHTCAAAAALRQLGRR